MATEQEKADLAYFIWEREGRIGGRELHYWLLAEQILEKRDMQLTEEVGDIREAIKENDKTAWYHFRYNLAFTAMALGTTLALLTPAIMLGGISSDIMGSVLTLISLLLIIVSGVKYRPHKFYLGRIKVAYGIMLIGILMIPVTGLVNHFRPGTLATQVQVFGFALFFLGLSIAEFFGPKKSSHVKSVR